VSFAEPRFRLREEQVDQRITVVSVEGEIHLSTAPEFSQLLSSVIASEPAGLVLDLTDVVFIDSTGLSVLLNALRDLTHAGGRLALASANPTVLRLFEITHLDETFDLHPDRARALRAVQPAGGSEAGAP
jgi:anti-sigma B factor antagonist